MKLFSKWFLMMAAVCTTSIFAAYQGLFTAIVSNDVSYLSVLTMLVFVSISILLGEACLKLDVGKSQNIHKKLEIGWFAADHCMTLGLLGTIVGFLYMMNKSISDTQDIQTIINQLKIGAGTALWTTAVGIVCSLLLQIQLFGIQQKIKK